MRKLFEKLIYGEYKVVGIVISFWIVLNVTAFQISKAKRRNRFYKTCSSKSVAGWAHEDKVNKLILSFYNDPFIYTHRVKSKDIEELSLVSGQKIPNQQCTYLKKKLITVEKN